MNIIITGASRGIGKEVAIQLANSAENKVIAIARDEKKLNALKKEVKDPARLIPIAFDLRHGDYELLSKEIRGHFSEIHVLINNAGILINKKISRLSADDFDQMMDVNVKSAFLLSQALIPLFEPNGHIVNISSMGGFQGSAKFPGLAAYSSSKGALITLTEVLAEEYKETGPSFNVLALGAVQTEMLEEAFPGYKAPISAKEMARYIMDFSLNGNKFYNGKVLEVSSSTP